MASGSPSLKTCGYLMMQFPEARDHRHGGSAEFGHGGYVTEGAHVGKLTIHEMSIHDAGRMRCPRLSSRITLVPGMTAKRFIQRRHQDAAQVFAEASQGADRARIPREVN